MLPSRENKKIGGVENCHFDVSGILKTSKGRSTEESTSAPSCSRTSRARGQHRSVEGVAWTNGELFGRRSRKLQNRIRATSQSGVSAKSFTNAVESNPARRSEQRSRGSTPACALPTTGLNSQKSAREDTTC